MKRCAVMMTLTTLLGLLGMAASGGGVNTGSFTNGRSADDDYRLDWRAAHSRNTVLSVDGVYELTATAGQAHAGVLEGGEFTLCAGFELAAGTGDADGDGDIDLNDYAAWGGCMQGPNDVGCNAFDLNADGDVDLHDFASFLLALSTSP